MIFTASDDGVPLSTICYSKEETVACIHDYYRFIRKMYLRDSAVAYPPVGGWPSITNDRVRSIGKSEEVAALLRELPYIANSENRPSPAQCAPFTVFKDWEAEFANLPDNPDEDKIWGIKIITESFIAHEDTPAHVVGLTAGGRDYCTYLLDTKLGIIYWIECSPRLAEATKNKQISDDLDDYAPVNEHEWRGDGPAFPIPVFFELLKDEFRKLHFVPTHGLTQMDIYTHYSRMDEKKDMIRMVQRTWRKHGWPDSKTFDKTACLVAIERKIEEKFPDSYVFMEEPSDYDPHAGDSGDSNNGDDSVDSDDSDEAGDGSGDSVQLTSDMDAVLLGE